MTANDKQVAGSHYQRGTVQHWDVVSGMGIGYLEGCSTKYLVRWRDKNGLQDLHKSQHFLEKLIEMVDSGSITKNRAKIVDSIMKKFYAENTIPYPEHLIIDMIFRWKSQAHLRQALGVLTQFISEVESGSEGGPTPAYVNQD